MDRDSIEDVRFVRLSDVKEEELVELMNDKRVARHLPLLVGAFSAEHCRSFLAAKQRIWEEHGYGPWAFVIRGELAGWGGLQPEGGDADFALVLSPKFWGWGRRIFERCRQQAFEQLKLHSITILLPPSRLNAGVVARLGFVENGEVTIGSERFLKFRLVRKTGAPGLA